MTEPLPPVAVDDAIWHVRDVGSFAAPAADGGTVYFGGDSGHVVAVEKSTGRLRWRLTPTGAAATVRASYLVVAGDMLIVGAGRLYGLDRATGAHRWTFAPGDGDGASARLAVEGETVFAASHLNRVYAVDTRTGAERWRTQLPGHPGSSAFNPVVRDGLVYVGITRGGFPTTGAFVALDATTGATRWLHEFDASYPGALYGCFGDAVFHGDNVIVGAEDGRIYAFDRFSGEIRWTASRVHPIPPEPGGGYGDTRPLAIAGDVIVAGSGHGILLGLDAATGSELWRRLRFSTPLQYASDDQTYYLTTDGLWAVAATTGEITWTRGRATPGYFSAFGSPPLPDGDRVYIAGRGGFYALSKTR